jgi:hypothetical protein
VGVYVYENKDGKGDREGNREGELTARKDYGESEWEGERK